MHTEPPAPPALACTPGAIPEGVRAGHFARAARLFTRDARERVALPDGHAFRFDAGALDELARWVSLERRCCPFLTFTLTLAPDDGPVWVRLTGPAGTRELLDAALPSP